MIGRVWSAVTGLFPFSFDGRQTLIYLMFSCSTGILTLITWWAMEKFFAGKQWEAAHSLADKFALGMLISVIGYACFVSVRSFKISKEGFDVQGRDPPDDASQK